MDTLNIYFSGYVVLSIGMTDGGDGAKSENKFQFKSKRAAW